MLDSIMKIKVSSLRDVKVQDITLDKKYSLTLPLSSINHVTNTGCQKSCGKLMATKNDRNRSGITRHDNTVLQEGVSRIEIRL